MRQLKYITLTVISLFLVSAISAVNAKDLVKDGNVQVNIVPSQTVLLQKVSVRQEDDILAVDGWFAIKGTLIRGYFKITILSPENAVIDETTTPVRYYNRWRNREIKYFSGKLEAMPPQGSVLRITFIDVPAPNQLK